MAVIKYHAIKRDANGKIVDEQWIPIYADAIDNRARRDYNLSDLHSASEARKNIGIVGDVSNISNSHNHDAHYNVWRLEDKQYNDSARAELDARLTHDMSSYKTETNSKIDTFTTNFTKLNASTNQRLTNEVNDRVADVNTLTNHLNTTDKNLATETQNRKQEDSNLQSQVNTNKANIQANKENLAATNKKLSEETAARIKGDTDLSTRLNNVNSTLTKKLSDETKTRTEQDNALSARINTNANNLATETTARINGDNALSTRVGKNEKTLSSHASTLSNHGTRITTLETTSKDHGTRITSLENRATKLNNDLTTETSARQTEDANLRNLINSIGRKFWVQGNDPGSAAPNNSLWFNTSSKLIYYRSGNTWVPFSATWL